ncbi:hypothetical protein [Kibdelosporangium aridum]|uniref:Uncharacterized protein n=1 Tax=Kibdelosporangium aridum TaxID=2030 RepID=A0A1Y5Y309_KIBAR|nr:hypothetical protein [Kibdelosporangium aridum]SMD24728.1 hypothetical protein SAMN05661093_08735 [Kibdelosporangium aridum]
MVDNGSATKHGARTATVNLPFVTAQFHAPELHLPHVRVPDRQEISAALRTVGSYLPSPRKTVYYGGLALMAALELIDWPVAAAVAVGTAVAGTGQTRESSHQEAPQQRQPTDGPATPPRGRRPKKQ